MNFPNCALFSSLIEGNKIGHATASERTYFHVWSNRLEIQLSKDQQISKLKMLKNVCTRFPLTGMSFEYMCFQPAVVGGLKGAEFASEWFMVSMMSLHMAIQT